MNPSACSPTARRPRARAKLIDTAWQPQRSIPCASASQRETSGCGRSAAPQASSTSNHSSQPRPVRSRITASDTLSDGPSVGFGLSATSNLARAAA